MTTPDDPAPPCPAGPADGSWPTGRVRVDDAVPQSKITGVDCIFCSIIRGEAPSWGLYEDDIAVAFLDIGQATPGHTLVVARRHAADIWSLSEDEAASVMRSVHRVASQLRGALQPLGMNVAQSNGPAAWQEVFHYHVHLVPRYGDDDLVPPWRPTRPSPETLAAVHRRILAE